jgi:uncharacterized protein YjiS (DUF1127 family)
LRTVLSDALVRLVKSVSSWNGRIRDRERLASFDDRMLRDIGIDRTMVDDDSTCWFWRLR